MTALVYISRGTPSAPRWCALRAALPGGRITTLCLDVADYGPVFVATAIPAALACQACRTELDAGTPGAAMAVEPAKHDIAIGRTSTPNLRGPRSEVGPVAAWDEWFAENGIDELHTEGP